MGIRDDARSFLDRELPAAVTYRSNDADGKYLKLTGYTQKKLTDSWDSGENLSGCNAFVGKYCAGIGLPGLGGFPLQDMLSSHGKAEAWVESLEGSEPQYGDILRHKVFHVDVSLGVDGTSKKLTRAAAGQNRFKADRYDTVKRVEGDGRFDWTKLEGWVDIEILAGEKSGSLGTAPTDKSHAWLYGWWTVWDGNTYYYFFHASGIVIYTMKKPTRGELPPAHPGNSGKYAIAAGGEVVVTWKKVAGSSAGATVETFGFSEENLRFMRGTSTNYGDLLATKLS